MGAILAQRLLKSEGIQASVCPVRHEPNREIAYGCGSM